ncbi:hypothetical protein ABZS88_44600 [Streptomyces sp. NPDC005480]|uniref:hypothetical protein n=1 Tax=Streptomyces sp. NPDC005480 TaxID=3154880 RepID=UPI0033A1F4CA
MEHLRLKAVLLHCPELDALTGHLRSFGQMLTERQGERLPQWLDAVRRDDLPGLHTLAAGPGARACTKCDAANFLLPALGKATPEEDG